MKKMQISSNWTKPMLILMYITFFVFPAGLFLLGGRSLELHFGMMIVMLLILVFGGLTIYLTFSLSTVVVYENEISFKKIFEKEKRYSFDKIIDSETFPFRRLDFVYVQMRSSPGKCDTYLILNNNALLSGEEIYAEKFLNELRKSAINKKQMPQKENIEK